MRILHLTDTHLGAWMTVDGAPEEWTRAHDHQAALDRALALADELDVDAVVHTGDVFDRSKPPQRWVEAAAASLLQAARRRPVVVLAGNHDRLGLSRTLPLHGKDLHIVDKPAQVRLSTRSGPLRLACVPYYRSVKGWQHGVARAMGGAADLLLVHQAFDGVVVPGLTFRVGAQGDTVGAQHLRDLPEVPAILCGHIHPRQVVDCGGVPVVHPGCLTHTAFRDARHPEGLAVWTLEDRPQWRFVDQPGRTLRWVGSRVDVDRVQAGDLVRVRDEAWVDGVRQRGGWLVGRPGPRRPRPASDRHKQLKMF